MPRAGASESHALAMELSAQRQMRPLTHDVTRHMVEALGFRVTRIIIHDCIDSTYVSGAGRARAWALGSGPDQGVPLSHLVLRETRREGRGELLGGW